MPDPDSLAYAQRQGTTCARVRLTLGQALTLVVAVAVAGAALAAWPERGAVIAGVAVGSLAAATLALRLLALAVAWRRDPALGASPEVLAALDRAMLPRYSILVPLYREPEVVPHLLAALAGLDYPRDRLDVQILVEPGDLATAEALAGHELPAHVRVTVSPVGSPRTKPRACNHGLAQATGELLVIYDAEDRPECDQLMQAVAVYRTLPEDVVCLQARLDHYNSRQSLPARFTAVDYLVWYRLVLPGLSRLGAPIPLGGTSNHFRVAALRALGGWDPFNVTEDCDLGMRIHRRGWRTRLLASTTWEEAVVGWGAWVRQRSRWLKGYVQTFLVHSRSLRGWRPGGFLAFGLMTGGLAAALTIAPLAWAVVALWLVLGWSVVDLRDPWSVIGLAATVALLLANPLVVALGMLACHRLGRRDLIGAAALAPLAWALHGLAAWRALWDLAVRPFHWAKTRHGQAQNDPVASDGHAAGALGAVLIAAVAVIAVIGGATWRIGREVAEQTQAVAAPVRMPMQRPVPRTAAETAATGLIRRDHPRRPPPWTLVEPRDAPATALAGPTLGLRAEADFPAAPLEMVSRTPRDLDQVAALAFDLHLGADAPPYVRAMAWWRDEDGRWFQHLSPQRLIPGAWTRIEVPLHQAAAWRALDHQRAWHESHLRRVSELGLRLFSAQPWRGAVTVASLRTLPFTAEELAARQRLAPRLLAPAATAAPVLARWQIGFDLGRTWDNPFDPDQVEVRCEVTGPDGAVLRVPAFWHQDYQRALVDGRERLDAVGAPAWCVRHRARLTGEHRWRIVVRDADGERDTGLNGTFAATPSTLPGYLRRSAAKPALLERDGRGHWPIGHNLAQAVDREQPFPYGFAVEPDQGTFTYDRYLGRMHGVGMDLARLWMTPWSFGLEGRADWRHFHGLGRYSLANAWRLDHVLDRAEELGIDLLLTSTHKSEYSSAWRDSVLNAALGGPLIHPGGFFSDPAALAAFRKRLRYCVARWGDSPRVAAWEFFGEANLVPGYDADTAARWHAELERAVRADDHGRHLVFTHCHNWQAGHPLWALPGIDCVQGNGYIRPPNHTPDHVENFDRYLAEVARYGKPVIVAEYGGRSELGAPSHDYLEAQLHSGIWASLVRPFATCALQWWWNFTDGGDLYGHYRGLVSFARGIDRLADDFRVDDPPLRDASGRLRASGMRGARSGFWWVHDRGIFERWRDLPVVEGAVLTLDLPAGTWRVTCWDTMAGAIVDERVIELPGTVALPGFRADLGVKAELVP